MHVNEREGRVVEVEADRHGAFVACHSIVAGFDHQFADVVHSWKVLLPRENKYVKANHGLADDEFEFVAMLVAVQVV